MSNELYRVKISEKLFRSDFDLSRFEDIVYLDDAFEVILNEKDLYLDSERWFYLDNTEVLRSDFSGNNYSPKIKFSPCYIDVSDNIKELVRQGIKENPKIKSDYSRLDRKLSKEKSVPITCVLDCCRAIGRDFWKSIEGELISGRTSSRKVKVPEDSTRLQEILVWVLTEGHIPMSHPSIEINQVSSNSQVLYDLADKFEEVFEVSNIANFSKTDSWSEESGERLIISSAPIRQLLVLKYDIPLGKKSKKLNQEIEVTQSNYQNLLKAFIQTEGSITKSNDQIRFEFKIQDENIRDICYKCLQKLECDPTRIKTEKTFNAGVYNCEGILRLFSFMKQFIPKREITKKTEKLIKDSNILSGMKNLSWSQYVQEARNELGNHPNKKFVKIHNQKFLENKVNHNIISASALGKCPVRLSVAITALKIIEKPVQQELPKYIQTYITSTEFQNHDTA